MLPAEQHLPAGCHVRVSTTQATALPHWQGPARNPHDPALPPSSACKWPSQELGQLKDKGTQTCPDHTQMVGCSAGCCTHRDQCSACEQQQQQQQQL